MEFLQLVEKEIKKTRQLLMNSELDETRMESWVQVLQALERIWVSQYKELKKSGLL